MKLADHEIIPAVLAKIARLEYFSRSVIKANSELRGHASCPKCLASIARCERKLKAADRLRDFATVELLCEGLGITRKEIE